MAKRKWGDEAHGDDDDGDPAPSQEEKKIVPDQSYFDKLKARLGQRPVPGIPATAEAEKPTGPVIYNDDGSIYRHG